MLWFSPINPALLMWDTPELDSSLYSNGFLADMMLQRKLL